MSVHAAAELKIHKANKIQSPSNGPCSLGHPFASPFTLAPSAPPHWQPCHAFHTEAHALSSTYFLLGTLCSATHVATRSFRPRLCSHGASSVKLPRPPHFTLQLLALPISFTWLIFLCSYEFLTNYLVYLFCLLSSSYYYYGSSIRGRMFCFFSHYFTS